MRTIAFHTLGCKVNQYDTEAMREGFERAGYRAVDMSEPADAYLINTCTVTGVGDQKSMKLIRRIHREHPDAAIIVAGCLAQRDAARVMLPGVKLVIGTRRRAEAPDLLARALNEGVCLSAVETDGAWSFEPLTVSRHEGRTRATMKIQEGCDRHCAYCIIPSVRGPVRSMPLDAVRAEAERLAGAGYREIVLTGIHLASYGIGQGATLLDAIRAVHDVPGVLRVRLGSLEPTVVTQDFIDALRGLPRVCRQFHLSMQSGSAGVLARMRRRYTPGQYLSAARALKDAFPGAALTTDVLTGFPGETEAEAMETEAFIQAVGFARIHVFPYSRRAGTAADVMPGQVDEAVKQRRAARLIEIGNHMETTFVQSCIGSTRLALFETALRGGLSEGYLENYVRVRAEAEPGECVPVQIIRAEGNILIGHRVTEGGA